MTEMQTIPNPFPGLRPFELDEQHLFFGREGQSEELLKKLRRTHFLTVVGTSGSGKSSLVRAGFLPLLYGGYLTQAGSSWRIQVFRPGDNPIRNMALALNDLAVFEISKKDGQKQQSAQVRTNSSEQYLQAGLIEAILRRSALGLIDFVNESSMRPHENLLIVVDQFEELFRFKNEAQNSQSGNDAAAFVKLLLEATRGKNTQIYVVLTMRSDFLGDCAQFRDLPEAINEGQYLIPRMTRDQQREAICSPTAVYGAQLTSQLVHRLLNDVGDNPDQLPILQHALMRTWDFWIKHPTREIEIDHYQEIGSMANALSLHADEAYNELHDEGSKQIAERLFKCLTEKGPDNREVRRPTKLRDICAIAEVSEEEAISVIDVFRQEGRSFLMPSADTTLDANSVIDISHESLIRGWQQLKLWVEEESESVQMYRRLASDALLHERDRVPYWRDPALQLALDWRKKFNPNAAWARCDQQAFDLTMAFLTASEAERDREIATREQQQREESAQKQRELESAQKLAALESRRAEEQTKAARRLRWLVAALALMVLIGAGTATYAMVKRSQADAAQSYAIQQRQIAENRSAEALLAQKYAEEQRQLVELQKQGVEKQRGEAEKQRKLAEAQSERALSAERAAREQANIAQQAKTRAETEAKRANDQARIAKTNLKEAQAANERDVMNRQGLIFFEKGETTKAKNEFTRLLASYAGDESGQWWVLHNLGSMNRQLGDYEIAVKSYKEALSVLQTRSKATDRNRVATLNRLAQTYREQNKYSDAESVYLQLLTILDADATIKEDPLYAARIRSDLAEIYVELGNDANAQPLFEYALQYRRDSLKPDHPELIATLRELGLVNLHQKKYPEAEKLFTEVLATWESKREPDDLNIAESYNSLARVYQEWGNQKRADQLSELSKDIREKNSRLDRSDKSEADALETLEIAYTDLKKYDRAEKLYKRELAVREKILNHESLSLAREVQQMADFYAKQQRYAEADPLYERAILIQENALKGNIATKGKRQELQRNLFTSYDKSADSYFKQERYSEAERLYKSALDIRDALLGKDSLAATTTLRALAQLFLKQGRRNDAELAYRRLLSIWQKHIDEIKAPKTGPNSSGFNERNLFMVWFPDPDNPGAASGYQVDPDDYVGSCRELAFLFVEQHRYAEAEPLFKEALSTLEWLTRFSYQTSMRMIRIKYLRDTFSREGLSAYYYATLADMLDAYASLLRKIGDNRETEAPALEARAKEARAKQVKSDHEKDIP
jgi:tetratricopeptide (TPR) repeat protein